MRTEYLPPSDMLGSAALLGLILREIGVGVILLDSGFRIAYANGAAQGEFEVGMCLSESGHRLEAVRPDQRRRLSQALELAQKGHRQLVELGPDDDTRMFACVPLAQVNAGFHVLVLCGKEQSLDPSIQGMYAQAMGLTSSESEVLDGICRGLVAQDIAMQRSVKVSTVKTQIGSIREKIGARSVAEVVANVSSLPPLAPRLAAY